MAHSICWGDLRVVVLGAGGREEEASTLAARGGIFGLSRKARTGGQQREGGTTLEIIP
jgi:hypothetical protein